MREFVTRLLSDPKTVRKFVVAFVGAISAAISEGLLPAGLNSWLTIVIVFLTAIGVYVAPNAEGSRTTE